MRVLVKKEIAKRGCPYCTEHKMQEANGRRIHFCKHDSCPFHELDKYQGYRQYLSESPDFFSELVKARYVRKRRKK